MRSLVIAALSVVSVACGSVHGGTGDSGGDTAIPMNDFAVAVAPGSIMVPITGGSDVTVTVTRNGAVGDVALTARDLPSGVTATFAPGTLPDGTDTSTLTIAVAPGAATGTSAITIAGTAGTLEHTATLMLTVSTITVSGTVAGGVGGITVHLVGKPSVMSAADGTFTFTDVTPPYDLYTVSTSGVLIKTVYYYTGLTRQDPVVTFAPGNTTSLTSSGTVTGALSGGNGGLNIRVAWSDTSGSAAQTNYTFSASWPFANTQAGTLYALQWSTKSSGSPDQIVYGATATTLTRNVTNTVNVAVATPTTATLTGTITSPAGYSGPQTQVNQALGHNSTLLFQDFSGMLDCTIPVVGAGTTSVFSTANLGAATTTFVHPELAANTDISFNLPAAAVQTTPANAATAVTLGTDITWTAPAATVNGLSMLSNAAKVQYIVYTTGTTARIPNVPEVPLPAATVFTWTVNGFGPHASVNEVATAIGAEQTAALDFSGPLHSFTTSLARTFTTQ